MFIDKRLLVGEENNAVTGGLYCFDHISLVGMQHFCDLLTLAHLLSGILAAPVNAAAATVKCY